jgi:hypothetical protein
MHLSLLDCVIFDREAVYASSEFTTGKRFYELCRQNKVHSGEELKRRLGDQYAAQLLEPNREAGIAFSRHIRSFGHNLVVTPNPFLAPQWSQAEYLGLWEQVIQRKCHQVFFNKDWQFSNGCTFEYLVGLKAGILLFSHNNKPLPVSLAKEMVGDAIVELENDAFDVPRLREIWNALKSF